MSDHITVCICTYKRPKLLEKLLKELEGQKTGDLFTYSVVVVDNDRDRSAEGTIASIKEGSRLDIRYDCEPEKNFSLARNRAVGNAKGNLIAFIDDDEFPVSSWLLYLYEAYIKYGVHGVLGPVKPHFETEPPAWIVKGKLCERESFKTGTVLTDPFNTRTGNALLSKEIFDGGKVLFDPEYGKAGGEDVDFFKRQMQRGRKFIWCDEAVAYESVPPERLRRAYFLKRALLRGAVNSRKASLVSFDTLKSIAALFLYGISLPFLMCLGYHLFMKYLIKICDHLGKLFGMLGWEVVKDRKF